MIDELLRKPYWIVDILPERVEKDSKGQYFAVEKYFLENRLTDVKQKHINLVLKLNCYMDMELEGEQNPPPAKIAEVMRSQFVYILVGEGMILSEPDDTHMTVFNPDARLLGLVEKLAQAEGLFVWKG